METVMKWGAMYGRLESGEHIHEESVLLGNAIIAPGELISRIGTKQRTMFEMKDGFHLQYVGRVDSHLLFKSVPTGCNGDPWYYTFMYVNNKTLLLGSHSGCRDINVDEVVFGMQRSWKRLRAL